MKVKKSGKQFAVIGLGRFGSSMAVSLYKMGYDVLAIDNDLKKVQDFSNDFTHVVQANSTDENALRELGILNFDVVIVAIGEDIESNIMTTLQLKEIGVKYIVAMARTPLQMKVLEKIGADRVVAPEHDMAQRVAYNLVSTNVMDYIELSDEFSIAETTLPKAFIGKTLIEANLRAKYNINVVAIKRGRHLIVSPMPSEKFHENDVIVVVGDNNGINGLESLE
ncbi:potassium channel family protein [Pectinatus cerevisiiphilus]|uniref:Trk system potassium uptake protein TrkA n=1 Tax=Pectinatus cerevisiiphilus TaxID=86956 RepID=A0A4R3K5A6_9FIRM|nr:TrkA family potassium uptake protein [Pectinatus cerevisiiphilus]TCS77963.1 trk system potassium uptake protein TrkA [Pectinatus cerevisiiphilus]